MECNETKATYIWIHGEQDSFLLPNNRYKYYRQLDRQRTHNVTLRRVRVTIFVLEKRDILFIQVCACGLIYLYGSLLVVFVAKQPTLIQELYRKGVVCLVINATKWLP